MAFPSECRISRANRFSGLCDRSPRGASRTGPVLALRALRPRELAGWQSRRPRRGNRRRYNLLRDSDHGELQTEHARSSQNNVLRSYFHLRTLTVAQNGELQLGRLSCLSEPIAVRRKQQDLESVVHRGRWPTLAAQQPRKLRGRAVGRGFPGERVIFQEDRIVLGQCPRVGLPK